MRNFNQHNAGPCEPDSQPYNPTLGVVVFSWTLDPATNSEFSDMNCRAPGNQRAERHHDCAGPAKRTADQPAYCEAPEAARTSEEACFRPSVCVVDWLLSFAARFAVCQRKRRTYWGRESKEDNTSKPKFALFVTMLPHSCVHLKARSRTLEAPQSAGICNGSQLLPSKPPQYCCI